MAEFGYYEPDPYYAGEQERGWQSSIRNVEHRSRDPLMARDLRYGLDESSYYRHRPVSQIQNRAIGRRRRARANRSRARARRAADFSAAEQDHLAELRNREDEIGMHPVALQELTDATPGRSDPSYEPASGFRRSLGYTEGELGGNIPSSGFTAQSGTIPTEAAWHPDLVPHGEGRRDELLWNATQALPHRGPYPIQGQMVPEGFQTDEVENRAAGERDNQGNRKNQFIQANDEQRKTAKQKAARDAAAKRLREEREERQERERQILEPEDAPIRTMDEYAADLEADVVGSGIDGGNWFDDIGRGIKHAAHSVEHGVDDIVKAREHGSKFDKEVRKDAYGAARWLGREFGVSYQARSALSARCTFRMTTSLTYGA